MEEQSTAKNSGNSFSSKLIIFILIVVLILLVGAGSFIFGKLGGSSTKTDKKVETSMNNNITPPPPPTDTSKVTCTGSPVISVFTATPDSVDVGSSANLNWEVANADSATIDQGIGQVSLPSGNASVTLNATTTYTITAKCGESSNSKQLVVTVGPSFAVTGVTVSVSPTTYSGVCPKVYDFSANITVNKAGDVVYAWEKSDGTVSSNSTLNFSGIGTQTVTNIWSKGSTGTGWYVLKIISPNALNSNKASFTNTCETVGNFDGNWYHNFGTANLTQSGTSVTGTYVNGFSGTSGTVSGSVSGNVLTGTWSIGGGSGDIKWTLSSSGNTFDGTWNGSTKWCGAKAGKEFPDGCSFQGSWNNRVSTFYPCAMSLKRKDTTVSGTYCNGTVTGSLSYSGSNAVVNGTWSANGSSGSIKFYAIGGYDAKQFNGNYNTSYRWCGWRSSSTEPSTCQKN